MTVPVGAGSNRLRQLALDPDLSPMVKTDLYIPDAARARLPERVIDVHGHAGVPAIERLIAGRPEVEHGLKLMAEGTGGPSMRHNRDVMLPNAGRRFASIEQRLTDLDRIGIDVQLVSPSPHLYSYWAEPGLADEIAGLATEAICDLITQAPDRLVGLGMVSLQHPDLAARQVREAMAAGLKGIEISASVGPHELSDPAFDPVWKAAEDSGALIFIHPLGTSLGKRLDRFYLANSVGQPTETAIALAHLIFGGVLDRFPAIKVLAAHAGGYLPHYIGRSDHAWQVRPESHTCADPPSSYLGRIWYDTVLFDDPYLRHLIDRVGVDRVMFGTDYPFDMADYGPQRLADALPEHERAAVLGGTATRLLGIMDSSDAPQ